MCCFENIFIFLVFNSITEATYIKLLQLSMGVICLGCVREPQCENILGVEKFIKSGRMYRNKHTNYPTWLLRTKTRHTLGKILFAHITRCSHFTFHKIWLATANFSSPQTSLFSIYLVQGQIKQQYFFFKWGNQ